MTVTERIDSLIQSQGLSRRQLAIAAGIPPSSFQSAMERGRNITLDMLQAVASALAVPVAKLLPGEKDVTDNLFWTANLNDKLKCVGCSLEFAEAHGEYFEWLEFPDGTLEVTDAELKELDQSTDSFLRFKLQELRGRHPEDFRPKRKRPQPPQDAPESTPASQEGKDSTPPPDGPGAAPEGE